MLGNAKGSEETLARVGGRWGAWEATREHERARERWVTLELRVLANTRERMGVRRRVVGRW